MTNRGFNLIGFDRFQIDTATYLRCSIHPYKRLLPSKTDPNIAFCPECGSEWPINVKDTITEQGIKSDIPTGTDSGPKILQPKKKRKLRDLQGNEITDPVIIQDAMQGKTVIRYHEQKVEGQQEKMDSYIVK